MRFCWIRDWTFIQTSTAFCEGSCIFSLVMNARPQKNYADLQEVEEKTMTVRIRPTKCKARHTLWSQNRLIFTKWDSNQANQEQACTEWGLSNQQEQLCPTTVTSTHLNRGFFLGLVAYKTSVSQVSPSLLINTGREINQISSQSIRCNIKDAVHK